MADDVDGRLRASADRLEALLSRMEATARRECDCNLAALRRENERLLELLRVHPPPRPNMLAQTALAAGRGARVDVCDLWGDAERGVPRRSRDAMGHVLRRFGCEHPDRVCAVSLREDVGRAVESTARRS